MESKTTRVRLNRVRFKQRLTHPSPAITQASSADDGLSALLYQESNKTYSGSSFGKSCVNL
jgi:hypothetical protein